MQCHAQLLFNFVLINFNSQGKQSIYIVQNVVRVRDARYALEQKHFGGKDLNYDKGSENDEQTW
jgi:hypothetical protein